MLEAYVAAGFPASEFWHLSPRLYLAHLRGAETRIKQARQDNDVQAWTTAALIRGKNLPELKVFLDQVWGSKDESPEHLQLKLEQLARAWGAEGVE